MALTAQPATHANWGRWPQPVPGDFTSMMESPNFMPYDTRAAPAPEMQRPMQPQYVVGAPYTGAPINTIAAPQFQQPAFSYVPYQSPPPTTPVGSPFRPEYQERPMMPEGPILPFKRDLLQSPASTRRGSLASVRSTCSNPSVNAKNITYNESINPADRVNFETDVDELMKAIQTSSEKENATQGPTPAATPNGEGAMSPASMHDACPSTPTDNKPKKKWVCDGPNCNKSFIQKTHLDIHRRTHTGAKPYVCSKEGCGLTFSQRGNLKTHMRRHTGEKPFPCRICGKLFAQRGNVRSHEETHNGDKPFVCILDGCNKTFSQLGNMKTHQNNFHKDTLKSLTVLFVEFARSGEIPEDQRELFDYFKQHYKNSNKGVKGRGKARTVAARKPRSQKAQAAAAAVAQIPQQPLPAHPGYDMSHAGYVMFEPQHNGAMLYDDQARHMSFTDRLY
ncbi:hypothetical protein VHEMI01102 [[Torrubiella] hemipterigena]|uniref:C2H2-type domain-containing protein n=1 Tax=[Torrubiella] hemipterigena TaxID=1531966 RepID=A0A0A1SS68_9HYPO|nr:hypothetical protein VHEMI01102 [[Torrubiella] hemipterigena]